MAEDHADSGFDDYAERVLRNEGRLIGLEQLVAETREADRKLIEQRSDSLAQELERRAEALLELVTARADAVLLLGQTERAADLREFRDTLALHLKYSDERWATDQKAMRLAVDSVASLFDEKIEALEERRIAATDALQSMVQQWREAETEARVLQAGEYARRLDVLNHNHERTQQVLATTINRELFNAEKEAQVTREGVLRDQIIAMDRNMLSMTPIVSSEKAHEGLALRMDETTARVEATFQTQVGVLTEKYNDLKARLDTTAGKSSGYGAYSGWLVAGLGLVISVIVLANAMFRK